jgi:nitronate monooxygenase
MTLPSLLGIALPIIQAPMAGAQRSAAAEQQGSGDFSPLWAGQNTSGCAELSAGELTHALVGV